MEHYQVSGMSCAACSTHVERAVRSVEGVTDVTVSLLTNSMQVEGTASPKDVMAAVAEAGYRASLGRGNAPITETESGEGSLKDQETPRLRKRLIASVVILIPLIYVSMGHVMWGWPLPGATGENHVALGMYEMLLSALIMVINQKFFISGFTAMFRRRPNMDSLVALGSAASFAYSTYALFAMTAAQLHTDTDAVMGYMHDFYFESAAMILTLITVGKMLESYAKGRTTSALRGLMELAPKTACLIRDGEEVVVPVAQVRTGDIFVVRPGESIPADGTVLEGFGAVDESALTGESIPADKDVGSPVSASTINQSGFLKCEAARVGEDTVISRVIQMVSDASATKAPIAKVADRVSGVFVPTVLLAATATLLVWLLVGQEFSFSLSRAISVLVISCPCALGLATPVAIMVGSGLGAKSGVLFKTAVSLEETGKVNIIALDKTGTITTGHPMVTDIFPVEGVSEKTLLKTALSLERKSEHPLASAIVEYAGERQISASEAEDFRAVAGNGLTGVSGGTRLCGGSQKFISSVASVPDNMANEALFLAEDGKTPLFFARDGVVCGMIAVADTMKEDAPGTVRALRHMGMRVVMLTGDNTRTAQSIAAQTGIDEVVAELLPGEKDATVRKLSGEGKVAMVGDGINDAPALTRADIGIAIGAGADIALDAADVVLQRDRLTDVLAAIRISRRTLRNIRQNLFWALFYNVILIPVAAGVFYHFLGWRINPMVAAAAMSLSSFCVVMNALRLNFINPYGSDDEEK